MPPVQEHDLRKAFRDATSQRTLIVWEIPSPFGLAAVAVRMIAVGNDMGERRPWLENILFPVISRSGWEFSRASCQVGMN